MIEDARPSTPLPWKVVHLPGGHGGAWDVTNDAGDEREEFSVVDRGDEGDMRFVVQAVNAYDRLRELEADASNPAFLDLLESTLERVQEDALDCGRDLPADEVAMLELIRRMLRRAGREPLS